MQRSRTWRALCRDEPVARGVQLVERNPAHVRFESIQCVTESKADKKGRRRPRTYCSSAGSTCSKADSGYALENLQKALEYDPNFVDAHDLSPFCTSASEA